MKKLSALLFLCYMHLAFADCGLSGSTEERIVNCGKSVQTARGSVWNLVGRSTKGATATEVWEDSNSGLVWSDWLGPETYRLYSLGKVMGPGAIELDIKDCQESAVQNTPGYLMLDCPIKKELACTSPAGVSAELGIGDRSFKVPTVADYVTAEEHGIREVLPNMADNYFWTETFALGNPASGPATWAFVGSQGRFAISSPWADTWKVRCVGR